VESAETTVEVTQVV